MSQQGKRKTAPDSSQPKKRVVLTHVQKRQLCLDFEKTPRPTQGELAVIYKIKQNTVSDILKKRDKWLLVDPDSEEASKQRERLPYFPQVEEALAVWTTNALAAELVINGDILREKAKIFAWEHIKWGEAKSAPLETLEEERKKLREIIGNYDY
ncbi:unnamed protein product [Rhizophagus irregularis]|nr:unnamed protein product [Rhizophagus irregularis]